MNKLNYYLYKDSKTGEAIYLEYDKINGYPITPKSKIADAIRVNKIVFVNFVWNYLIIWIEEIIVRLMIYTI